MNPQQDPTRRTTRSMSRSQPPPQQPPRPPSRGRSPYRSPYRIHDPSITYSTRNYEDDNEWEENEEEIREIPSPSKKQPEQDVLLPGFSPVIEDITFGDPEGNPVFTHLIDEIEAEDTKKDLERQLYEEQQEAKFIEEAINQEKVRIMQERRAKLQTLQDKETSQKLQDQRSFNQELKKKLNELRGITVSPVKKDTPDPDFYGRKPSPSGRRSLSHHTYPPLATLKIPTPEKFDGSPRTPVADWLFQIDQYFHVTRAREEERTSYASMLLKGHALIWWKSLVRDRIEPRSWDQFKTDISFQFQIIDANQKARNKLKRLQQTSSVQAFITEFTTLTLQIQDMSHPEMFYTFKDGLKAEIRNEMERRSLPMDLKTWQIQAQQFDDLIFNQRRNSTWKSTYNPDSRPNRPDFKKPFNPDHKKDYRTTNTTFKANIHQINGDKTKEIVCFNCNKKGHFAKDCRSNPNTKWIPRNKSSVSWKDQSKKEIKEISVKEPRQINIIKVNTKKFDEKAELPAHKTAGSAGLDIKPNVDGVLAPFETGVFTTGLAIEIPPGYHIQVHSRSSILLEGILIEGIIDSDYRGELKLIIHNRNPESISFKANGRALAQLLIIPVEQATLVEVKELTPSTRKGGFGSTNINQIQRPGKLTYTARINEMEVNTLIDSGADGIFLGEDLAQKLGLELTSTSELTPISVANGEECMITQEAKDVPYEIQGFKGKTNILIMPFNHNQLILGNQWLSQYNPDINWITNEVTLTSNDIQHIFKPQQPLPKRKINVIQDINTLKKQRFEESDLVTLIMPDDIEEELGLEKSDFYDKDREDIQDADLEALKQEFNDIFSNQLPKGREMPPKVQHYITLEPNTRPTQAYQYRLSPNHRQIIEDTMAELLKQGHIEPSTSPWRAPLLVVSKKDGQPRVVIDFRMLNKHTKSQAYKMKDVYELLELIAGHKYFSLIDLTDGYLHIPVAKECREMTAFSVPGPKGGQYQFTVMPFGLKGAPATFQQFVDDIFRPYLGEFAAVYIDDLAIFSDTREDHLKHLRIIFQTMRNNRVFAKAKKCYFMQSKVPYLGHYVSESGIETDPKKIEAMTKWPIISNIKQLRGFLGLTGYYRRFIKDYATIALPLTKLLKEEEEWKWTLDQESSKNTLIKTITNASILIPPDYNQPMVLTTDASKHALGAVLSQNSKPIAFLSKTFDSTQQKWSTYEQELFAVIYALKKWECYLKTSIPFKIITDNHAVSYIKNQTTLTSKQFKWISFLEEFNCSIEHRPGVENKVADGLSRKDVFGISIVENTNWLSKIKKLSKKVTLLPWMTRKNGLIYKDNRIFIPGYRDIKTQILSEYHDQAGHFSFKKTRDLIMKNYFWPNMIKDIHLYTKSCDICQRTKSSTQSPYGLLQPIPPPTDKFQTYSMDFIGPLPQTPTGFNGILVIIDTFTKAIKLTPINFDYTAEDVALVFFNTIIRNFGIPQKIISDRDPRFTGFFWKELFKLTGTSLGLSTAFHPQSDGQTECTNRTLEEILRASINGI
jgi:deoxyuridine 5'-triphosphate nucleotidohydrolase